MNVTSSTRIITALLGVICISCPLSSLAQTAVSIRVEYPDAEYVEVKTDNDYCITELTVHIRGANISRYKITQKLCRAHLQELSLQGESSIDIQNHTGSFGWALYVPFGKDEENFGDVAGSYVFALGKNTVDSNREEIAEGGSI